MAVVKWWAVRRRSWTLQDVGSVGRANSSLSPAFRDRVSPNWWRAPINPGALIAHDDRRIVPTTPVLLAPTPTVVCPSRRAPTTNTAPRTSSRPASLELGTDGIPASTQEAEHESTHFRTFRGRKSQSRVPVSDPSAIAGTAQRFSSTRFYPARPRQPWITTAAPSRGRTG